MFKYRIAGVPAEKHHEGSESRVVFDNLSAAVGACVSRAKVGVDPVYDDKGEDRIGWTGEATRTLWRERSLVWGRDTITITEHEV